MKKRLLPIPLVLLTPIVMLVIVVMAGIYRFSLSDEDILAKFPNSVAQNDAIMQSVFNIRTQNPWTVKVPHSSAYTFIDTLDEQREYASGHYIDGEEKGIVSINLGSLQPVSTTEYMALMTVSNQGSGVFNYLALFYYDEMRFRMILGDSALLGDRVVLTDLMVSGDDVTVSYRQHGADQAMAEAPQEQVSVSYRVIEQKLNKK